jgi:hypothetical protein
MAFAVKNYTFIILAIIGSKLMLSKNKKVDTFIWIPDSKKFILTCKVPVLLLYSRVTWMSSEVTVFRINFALSSLSLSIGFLFSMPKKMWFFDLLFKNIYNNVTD